MPWPRQRTSTVSTRTLPPSILRSRNQGRWIILELIEIILLVFLVAITYTIIRLRDLFAAVMLSGIFSLLSAGLFTIMDAVDVAFTEAAVGAGISTVLMVATLAQTQRRERLLAGRWRPEKWWAFGAVCFTGAVLVYGTLDMPRFGDPEAPAHRYMAPRFLEESIDEVGPPNIVTSILASYRSYDTFGETTVVFTAAVGALLLLGGTVRRRQRSDVEGSTRGDGKGGSA